VRPKSLGRDRRGHGSRGLLPCPVLDGRAARILLWFCLLLPLIEDRLDDFRREAGEREKLADVGVGRDFDPLYQQPEMRAYSSG
jgi:hypothetical protein